MAESLAAEIQDDFLTCTICHLPFNQPKALPCLHTFCKGCLSSHAETNSLDAQDGTSCLYCPTCQQLCDLPEGGVEGLQDNDLLRSLLDVINTKALQICDPCKDDGNQKTANFCCVKCEDFLCEECATVHKRTRVTKDHLIINVSYMKEICRITNQDQPWRPLINVRLLAKFGTEGEDLSDPVAVITNKADEVIVSNSNKTLTVHSVLGECKKKVDQTPFMGENGALIHNKCLAITAEGYVAVAMKKEQVGSSTAGANVAVIQSFAGREISNCFLKTKNPETCEPHGIAITNTNHIIVTDVGRHCIYIFDPDFKLMKTFGKRGSKGSKQFKYPYYVAVNLQMDIIISDYGNHCVKVFQFKSLDCKLRIGSNGTASGYFTHPMGICADRFGNIFVADRDNHRVQMFDPRGQFLANILEETYLGGQDIRPMDLTMTNNSHLVILLKGVEGMDYSKVHIYQLRASKVKQNKPEQITKTPVEEINPPSVSKVQNGESEIEPKPKTPTAPEPTPPTRAPTPKGALVAPEITQRAGLLPPIGGSDSETGAKFMAPSTSLLAPAKHRVQPDLVLQSIKESIVFDPDKVDNDDTDKDEDTKSEAGSISSQRTVSSKKDKQSQVCVIL